MKKKGEKDSLMKAERQIMWFASTGNRQSSLHSSRWKVKLALERPEDKQNTNEPSHQIRKLHTKLSEKQSSHMHAILSGHRCAPHCTNSSNLQIELGLESLKHSRNDEGRDIKVKIDPEWNGERLWVKPPPYFWVERPRAGSHVGLTSLTCEKLSQSWFLIKSEAPRVG